jgi:hypothetical protein
MIDLPDINIGLTNKPQQNIKNETNMEPKSDRLRT